MTAGNGTASSRVPFPRPAFSPAIFTTVASTLSGAPTVSSSYSSAITGKSSGSGSAGSGKTAIVNGDRLVIGPRSFSLSV